MCTQPCESRFHQKRRSCRPQTVVPVLEARCSPSEKTTAATLALQQTEGGSGMSAVFHQSAAPRWAGAVKMPSDVWGQRCVTPCCASGTRLTRVLRVFVPVEEQRLSWLTSWAPNKEGQAGRGSVLCKYPSGLRKEQGRKREADGLQPYMEKELLFPGFVILTPGMVPDVAPAAPWCHQEVQLLKPVWMFHTS